jgi:hypothetical protein
VTIFDIAIVGDGPAALACFAQFRSRGIPSDRIVVYGDGAHPLARLERYARALGQQQMRSESTGHLAPTEFPGLAAIDAYQRRSPWPLLATLVDAYRPSLRLLIERSASLAQRYGFAARKVSTRVGYIHRRSAASPAFECYDEQGQALGVARHLVLALGHAGVAWPAALEPWRDHPLVQHAYQEPVFHPGARVAVIGGGMAAAHLWIAALQSGSSVLAIHRGPIQRQVLNAPRCSFTAAGIDAYRSFDPDTHQTFHKQRRSSFPWRWGWELALKRARHRSQFADSEAEVTGVIPSAAKLTLLLSNGATVAADLVVCATGFQSSARAHPIVNQLADDYALPLRDGMLCIADNFTLPEICRPGSTCSAIGVLARWALPVADTFVGMKYVARRLISVVQVLG